LNVRNPAPRIKKCGSVHSEGASHWHREPEEYRKGSVTVRQCGGGLAHGLIQAEFIWKGDMTDEI
jgi:hypothetical protein